MAFSPRGLGWKKDLPKKVGEKPDFVARPKLGLAPPPKFASNRSNIISMIDQGSLGSCTTNSVALMFRAAMIQAGITDTELISRLFLYYLARSYDHDAYNDNGTYLRNVLQAAVKFGFPRESLWPYSDRTEGSDAPFRTMPSSMAFSSAFDQIKGASYHRINSTGMDRVVDVRRAIAAGYCVVFGTLVSNDFANNILGSGPIPPPTGKSIAGGHALCLAEYEDEKSFGVPNTWGTDWGDNGWCKLSTEYIASPDSDDFWIATLVPKFSDAPIVA